MKEQPKSRESGYYWVKIGGDWIIAQWAKSFWLLMGIYREDDDSDFEEIDERKISRVSGEPPKPDREHFISIETETNGISDNFRLIEIDGNGRAVFQNNSKHKTTIKLPYEFLPKLSGDAKAPVNSAHSYTEGCDMLSKNDTVIKENFQ